MNDSEIIDKAHAISACLSYNDDTPEGNAKQIIKELCHRLGQRTVRIHKKKDGFLMIDLFGKSRFLNFIESVMWVVFKKPPFGFSILP